MAGWWAEEEPRMGQGMGRNRRQAVCGKNTGLFPKMHVLVPHPRVTGAALREPWDDMSPLQITTLTHRISWALWAYEWKCAVQMSSIRNRKWSLFHSRFLGYATLQSALQLVVLALLVPSLHVCPWKGSTMTDKNWRLWRLKPGQEEQKTWFQKALKQYLQKASQA